MKYIKYLKIFVLVAVGSLFAACSDDDSNTNTNECTVGFENTAITVNETDRYVNLPINVSGLRNGNVRLEIGTAPVGNNGAVEGEDYKITDKTLNLNTDSSSTATINVELQLLDNNEVDGDRTMTISIINAEGAEITTAQTTITIEDNDDVLYERFFGTWILTATDVLNGGTISKEITISGPTNANSPHYENRLYATSTNLLNQEETFNWDFLWTYDEASNTGTLSFVCTSPIGNITYTDQNTGEEATTQASWYGMSGTTDGTTIEMSTVYVGQWSISDDGVTPSTISFANNTNDLGIAALSANLLACRYSNITLTKK